MAKKLTAKERGNWGEEQVARYLLDRGCELVERQYHCRYGELDLIARDGKVLCFVEVKLRKRTDFGLPRESVTEAKKRRLRLTASFYLSTHDPDEPCRFDVAEVYPKEDGEPPEIIYLEEAF